MSNAKESPEQQDRLTRIRHSAAHIMAQAVRDEFADVKFAIGPAIWLFKWNKRRKLGPNAVPSFGYDLTGNESGVCPECGRRTKAEIVQV